MQHFEDYASHSFLCSAELVSQVVSHVASALFKRLWSLKTDAPVGMNIFLTNISRTAMFLFETSNSPCWRD